MKSGIRSPAIRRATERARRAGYTVRFRPFVEDAKTPDLLGRLGGRCDYEAKEIVIGTHGRTRAQIAAILEHECEHAEGALLARDRPEFGLVCGNRSCTKGSLYDAAAADPSGDSTT